MKADRRKGVLQAILIACASFLVLDVATCMAIYPGAFQHPGWGLSQFGGHRSTLVPYYLGFVLVVTALGRIARLTWGVTGRWRHIRLVFLVSAVIMAGIGLSSANLNAYFLWTHISLCVVLGIVILITDIWLVRQPETDWIDYVATITAIAGMAVVELSGDQVAILHASYWGEVMIFLSAFWTFGHAALEAVSDDSKSTGNAKAT